MNKSFMLEIRSSPHIKSPMDTITIMRNVVWALLPIVLFSIYCFGLSAALLILVTVGACVLAEWTVCFFAGGRNTLGDWSAVITGLLLGLTLPPCLPLWMAALGGFCAIWLGKTLFGGLGANPLNPALVGRAFLMAAFPASLTTWSMPLSTDRFTQLLPSLITPPLLQPNYDGISGATPLGMMKFGGEATPISDLLLGFTGGSLGETSAILILLAGLYLAWRGMLNWRIPTSILLTVFLTSGILYLIEPEQFPGPVFQLFAGGLFLGAFFMATDMVTSPVTHLATWLYGAFIGLVIVVIRLWGGLPEGVMYAILLGNAFVSFFERFTRPLPFGGKVEARL